MNPGTIPPVTAPSRSLARLLRTTNSAVGIRQTAPGLFRVAPKLSRTSSAYARNVAGSVAQTYGDIDQARRGAADLLRRYRACQMLSAKLDRALRT